MIQKTIIGKNQSRKNWVLVKCTRTPKFNCYHKSQIFALRMYQWFDFCKYEKKTIRSKGDNDFLLCFCNGTEIFNFDAFLFHTHMKWWYHLRSICDLYRAHDARVWFSEAIRHCYCHLHPLFMDSCAQIFPVFLKKRIRKYMAIVGLFLSNTDFFSFLL